MTFGYNSSVAETACESEPSMPPTIGNMTLNTLDMQAETMMMISNILSLLWGEKTPMPETKPEDNLESRLMAIQANQKAIMCAVKAITERL